MKPAFMCSTLTIGLLAGCVGDSSPAPEQTDTSQTNDAETDTMADGDVNEDSTSGADESPATPTEGGEPTTSGSSSTDTANEGNDPEGSGSTTEGSDGSIDPDAPCDIWLDDCPRGFKCMPWDDSGSGIWNSSRCTPIDPDPVSVGESCTAEAPTTGVDNCEARSMCWRLDEQGNGTCVAFCEDRTNPSCEEPATSCNMFNGGAVIVCLPACDPLSQDCPQGQGCYAQPANSSFTCLPDASGGSGATGDTCGALNTCAPGLVCVTAESVPSCDGPACCSPWCDLGLDEPDAACLEGQQCVSYLPADTRPSEFGNVGVCVIP